MIEFELSYLVASLVAGFLTILAPCVLPLLPVIIGSSTAQKNYKKPVIIVASLGVSIIIFSLLLKASTALLGVPVEVWRWLSGGILLSFGIVTLFPELWEKLSLKLKLNQSSNVFLGKAMSKEGYIGSILIGAALGPVFSSCSPTYLAIVGTIIPASYATGMIYLLIYVFGLAVPLLAVAFLGQKFASKLGVLSNPHGWFKKGIGVLFIVVGIAIIGGYDKQLEAWLIERGVYDGIINLETDLTS